MTRRKSHRMRRRERRLRREAAEKAAEARRIASEPVSGTGMATPDEVAEACVTESADEARATGCAFLAALAILAMLAWIAFRG